MADRDYKKELLKLVEDVNQWTREHLEKKHPEIAERVYLHSSSLQFVADARPEEEARAALHGADMMLAMLLEDAYRGQGVSHFRKDLPNAAPEDKVLQLWYELHEQDSEIGKTKAVKKIMASLGCSERTVWSRLKEAGI